jgi:hypothetical protein
MKEITAYRIYSLAGFFAAKLSSIPILGAIAFSIKWGDGWSGGSTSMFSNFWGILAVFAYPVVFFGNSIFPNSIVALLTFSIIGEIIYTIVVALIFAQIVYRLFPPRTSRERQ